VNTRKTVLILGSGFSRAVFPDDMPTVTQLARRLCREKALRKRPYSQLLKDPELLLSYLHLNQPWKRPEEALRDRALFEEVQLILADYIANCEGQAFQSQIPDWTGRLMEYLHKSRAPVISFNYDTVVERLVHHHKLGSQEHNQLLRSHDLYDLPLTPIVAREGNALLGKEIETFRLIKLHGSINWFYSGAEGFPGEQVYYRDVDSDSPAHDNWGGSSTTSRRIERLSKDKLPLIIPPVAEKSGYYDNRTIRILWEDARKALKDADELFCVGYSLPMTDLTTKLFLQTVAKPRRVVIVNKKSAQSSDGQRVLDWFTKAFPGVEVDCDRFMCEGAVEKMTDCLTS